MRTLFASLLLLAACSSGGKQPSVANAGGGGGASIRSVDFLNRTYDSGDGPLTVVNGEVEIEIDPEMPEIRGWFGVGPPVYGDVDGDGVEDAIVVTSLNGGGTGTFTSGEIYTMRAGSAEPVRIGEIPGGDRGDGGLEDIRIEGGQILVDRYQGEDDDAACCPSKLVKEVWFWNRSAFVEKEDARQVVTNPAFEE